ncbi:MAG: protein phosphatase 2C domain-containing protein [Thermaerobacter sp.]|nr:protein phosphatase 2C domain-containing protein [Thermaerobacter sp.]
MEFSVASDAGLVRSHNEDSFALLPLPHGALLAVADGVGGSKSGEVASEIATRTFVELLSGPRADGEPDSALLRQALEAANESILEKGQSSEHQGMGTTMTGAWVSHGLLVYAHAGDSRLYLYRDEVLSRVTQDHSIAQELVRRGSLLPEQAENHPQRHVLTRFLGLHPFNCDEGQEGLRAGDVVLLCTDGLTSALSELEVRQELAAGFDGVALRLIEAANRAGGPDNTTVVAVRIEAADAGGTTR